MVPIIYLSRPYITPKVPYKSHPLFQASHRRAMAMPLPTVWDVALPKASGLEISLGLRAWGLGLGA